MIQQPNDPHNFSGEYSQKSHLIFQDQQYKHPVINKQTREIIKPFPLESPQHVPTAESFNRVGVSNGGRDHTARISEIIQRNFSIESLMAFALFKLQEPLVLTNENKPQLRMSRLPPQQSYYGQLDVDAERVKERVKEESRVVQFVIEKQKRVHDTHDRLEQESNSMVSTMMMHQSQYHLKQFKKQVRFDFQQLESKTSEVKDFYEESLQLTELFQLAANEYQIGLRVSNIVSISNNSRIDLNQDEPQVQLTESRSKEVVSQALRLYSDLQNFIKKIEAMLSEQRRLSSISQNNLEFKSLNQSLLQQLGEYPKIQNNTLNALLNLYYATAEYFRGISIASKQFLIKQNFIVIQLRDSITGIERLLYLESRVTEILPSFGAYFEVIDRLISSNSLQNTNSGDLPHPSQLNSTLIHSIKNLHFQFKFTFTQTQSNRYFQNMLHKVYKRSSMSIHTVKRETREQNQLADDIYVFLTNTMVTSQNLKPVMDKVLQLDERMKIKTSYEDMLEMVNSCKSLQLSIRDFEQRQLRIDYLLQQDTCKNLNLVHLLHHLSNELIQPTIQKLHQQSSLIDKFTQLGDLGAVIRFQELKQILSQKAIQVKQFLNPFIDQITIQINNSKDLEEQQVIQLQRGTQLQYNEYLTSLQTDVIDKEVNESIKSQAKILIYKYSQFSNIARGLQVLIGAFQYLTTDNLNALAGEFNEIDQNTPIGQLQELMEEQVEQLKQIKNDDLQSPWLEYNAIKYEQLIQNEEIGFIWILEVLRKLDSFQKSWQRLFQQNQQVNQPDPIIYVGQIFHNRISLMSNKKIIPKQIKLEQEYIQSNKTSVLRFTDLIEQLRGGWIQDIYQCLQYTRPQTPRWDYYHKILSKQVEIIYRTYYTQFVQRIDIYGTGNSLKYCRLDKAIIEEINVWIKKNLSQMIETAGEVISGANIAEPKSVDDLLRILIIIQQTHERVKQINLQNKIIQSQNNIPNMISLTDMRYQQNLEDIEGNISIFQKGIQEIMLERQKNPEKQLPAIFSKVNRVIPMVLLLLSLQYSKYSDAFRVLAHINIHLEWAYEYITQLKETSILDAQLPFQILNYLLLDSPLQLQTLKQALELDVIPPFIQLSKLQNQIEEFILQGSKVPQYQSISNKIQEFQDNKYILNTVLKFQNIATRQINFSDMYNNFVKISELNDQVNEDKIQQLPGAFVEQVYLYMNDIIKMVNDLDKALNDYGSINIGILKINFKPLKNRQQEILRWGVIAQTILNDLKPKRSRILLNNDSMYLNTFEQQWLMNGWLQIQ